MRPRLILIESISPLEWRIRPALEEWADVATLRRDEDAGALLDERGWDSCVVAGDEWGVPRAVSAAESAPGRVAGLALGHAALYAPGADKRDVEPEVWDAYRSLARLDYRSFARSLTQVSAGSYDDEIVDAFVRTVPHETLLTSLDEFEATLRDGVDLEPRLKALDVPLLLARHSECLLWSRDGFDAAQAALPTATCVHVADKPSVSAEFASALRKFCETLDG